MAEYSFPWPETSGPVVGDGRKITAEEYAAKLLWMFGSGVVPLGNMLAVTSSGANTIDVDSGAAIIYGRFYTNSASLALSPASAAAGQTRKDSVILELDWDGSGATEQYTVRAVTKEGSAVAYPSMTQTINVIWQVELYRYTIDDAGAISAITDVRAYCQFSTEVVTAMLVDGILSADATGRGKVAAGFLGADAISRALMATGFFDAATVAAKFGTDSFTNAVLLQLIQDGAFANSAAIRALFADAIWTRAKLANGDACSVIGRGANSAGVPADIAAVTNGHVLRRVGNVLGFGTIGADSLAPSIDAQPLGFNADKVDGYDAADLIAGGIIVGAIILWSGTLGGSDGHRPMIGAVPNEDWHLCNGDTVGSVNTPDLRDKFIVGAGLSYAKGATGGSLTSSHTHAAGTLLGGAHYHAVEDSNGPVGVTAVVQGTGALISLPTSTHFHTNNNTLNSGVSISGSTAASAPTNLPPYYGLYYLMKVA